MQIRQRWGLAALAALGTMTVAGCGSSTSDSQARIRYANFAANAATANVTANVTANGLAGGDLNQGEVSGYSFVGGVPIDFGYTTTATLPADIGTIGVSPQARLQVNVGSFYTGYLIGRSDVRGRLDQRFLQTVVTGNQGAAAAYTAAAPYAAPPSGQANLRILNAAPDAGFVAPNTTGAVDVLINGKVAYAGVAYPPLLRAVGTTTSAGVAYAPAAVPVTPYQAVPSGTLSVQVNLAGTSTVIVPPTNVPVSSGNVYTLVVLETNITPSYSVSLVSD